MISKMKQLGVLFLLAAILTLVLGMNNGLAIEYCSAKGQSQSFEWVESITVGSFTKSSGSNGGYADFTNETIELSYGSISITLVPGFANQSYSEFWKIWLDFNQDGIFSADEVLFEQSANTTITSKINIPPEALEGETRMRVIMRWGSSPGACGVFSYGEVEDYTVKLNASESDYCAAYGQNQNFEWIESIGLGSFTNKSGADGGYGDFTEMVIDLDYGLNSVTLSPGFSYSPYVENWRIWVDLNQDKVFADDELLLAQSSNGIIEAEVLIPDNALGGTTRMRVLMQWGGTPRACGSFYYGEVEDYTVNLDLAIPQLGVISDMVAGKNPDIVYAIDEDNQALYFISTNAQQIIKTVRLRNAEPVAMDYSAADNSLYIVSNLSGSVEVYDLDTSVLSEIMFSSTNVGRDIAAAPILRRLYVLSPDGCDSYLSIIDMDTGELLVTDEVGGSSLVVDERTRTMFTGNRGLSPSTIYKYSIKDDHLELVQNVRSGGNGRKINISPDGRHVVLPCGGGSGAGYTVYDFDTTELNNVFGEWDIGTYPAMAAFRADGKLLYGTNGDFYDNYLYVMDASEQNYRLIRKLEFPYAADYSVFTPNSDGTVVVGFSYDDYDEDEYKLYFFTDVLPEEPGPIELGKISDMVAGSDPEFVYALDRDNKVLYFISTSLQQIVKTFELPYTQPVAMDYSASDDSLYIVSAFSGAVTVFDLATNEISAIPFSYTKDGRDIAVAPMLRRLYVLSPDGYYSYLSIIDMDTGNVILETVGIDGSSLVVDENTQMLFTGNSGLSPATMYRYSVSYDNLKEVQRLRTGGNGRKINISPDGHHIVFPCGGGNSDYGYKLFDFDATEFDNVFGEWDIGTYPAAAQFRPDGSLLYGTNGDPYDNYLYVMDTRNYRLVRKLEFPNTSDYAVFSANSDGTVVVGFSYDDYYEDEYALYFFTDVLPEPRGEIELGKISDMVAGSDPETVYALDQDNQVLYFISTSQQQIVQTFDLPYTQPVAMDYSPENNSLYIVSAFSGDVTVFDLNDLTISPIPFSYSKDGRDIAVAEFLGRIYVLSPTYSDYYSDLSIINLDTGDVMAQAQVVGTSLVVEETSRMLFIGNRESWINSINKYTVAGDNPALVQSLDSGRTAPKINISPDGKRIVFPCSGGSVNYSLCDFDANDLENQFGGWIFGSYGSARRSEFSPNGEILFSSNYYDEYLYIMDADTRQEIRKLAFPYADAYAVFTPNADGSSVVGFSYDNYDKDHHQIYYFTNVGILEEPGPPQGLGLVY